MKRMVFSLAVVLCWAVLELSLPTVSHGFLAYGERRPPRPAPHCVWIDGFYTREGYFIPGHWSCNGPPRHGRTWVPGYYEDEHRWRNGYWDTVPPRPHRKAIWVPGHFDLRGRWVPGHWE